jgi:hypothetical protein
MIRNKILESVKKAQSAKMGKKYGHLFAKAVPHPLATDHSPSSLPISGRNKNRAKLLPTLKKETRQCASLQITKS